MYSDDEIDAPRRETPQQKLSRTSSFLAYLNMKLEFYRSDMAAVRKASRQSVLVLQCDCRPLPQEYEEKAPAVQAALDNAQAEHNAQQERCVLFLRVNSKRDAPRF